MASSAGYSVEGCPDCVGVEGDRAACMEMCNQTELGHCAQLTEDRCQVPGTGCRWSASREACYDPTYKIDHPDAWLGLVCTEKCGTSLEHGYHAPRFCTDKDGEETEDGEAECTRKGGIFRSELERPADVCPMKGNCTERGTMNRCYQPCAADQKEGVFDFLCQDSCERHCRTPWTMR